ncbi:hypothetical protein CHS0354_018013 [Potamilus streckersoni]|uniref:Uncharacterized protein n=1 Tax=Potamilus streckersoni TaxID=2493646 RepID=A0AAE0RMZ5_9BIVA|nr:hypothetical protein CHS0354_018013 [Potamilus streckersoni]
MMKAMCIILWIWSYIGHDHLTCGDEMYDICGGRREGKGRYIPETEQKYDVVEEKSFFLHNKILLVAGSRRTATTRFLSKGFASAEEEITGDIKILRQKSYVRPIMLR